MKRTLTPIPDSPYLSESTEFESADEATQAKSILPAGEYPMPLLPGHVLSVRYEPYKVCGKRIIEVLKSASKPANAAVGSPVGQAQPGHGLAERLGKMSDAQLQQYAVERSVTIKPKCNRVEMIAAITLADKE